MALSTQEFLRLKATLANKQVQSVEQGIKPKPLSDRLSDIGTTAASTYGQAIRGEGEFAGKGVLERSVRGTAELFNVAPKAAFEMLPEKARTSLSKVGETVGKGFKFVTDNIANTKLFKEIGDLEAQGFLNRETAPELYKTIDALQTSGALGQISGDILLADQTAKLTQSITNLTKKSATKTFEIGSDVVDKIKRIFSSSKAKIGDEILPIPETVKTTLKRTNSETLAKYINQAKNASIDQKSMTPLELAGDKAMEALNKIQSKLDQYGKFKGNSIGNFGDKNVGTIATKFRQQIENNLKGKSIIGEGDSSLVKNILEASKKLGNNPTAKQVDSFIDDAQNLLYTSTQNLAIPVSEPTTALLKKYLGELNNSLKSKLPTSYGVYNTKFSNIIELRDSLNKALGFDANKGGSLLKKVFSSTDSGTKKLFEQIAKETGIELTDEAVLAKFAMELFGDSRQASILQQLSIPTQRGLIEKIISSTGKFAGLEDWIKKTIIKKASKLTK